MGKSQMIMNKKNLLVCVFIVFSFMFYSCSTEPEYKIYHIEDVSIKTIDTLQDVSIEYVTDRIEILIEGSINGKASIKFENGSGRYNTIEISGDVSEVYETEWYDSRCQFIYEPISHISEGSIMFKYRIY